VWCVLALSVRSKIKNSLGPLGPLGPFRIRNRMGCKMAQITQRIPSLWLAFDCEGGAGASELARSRLGQRGALLADPLEATRCSGFDVSTLRLLSAGKPRERS